ncbi:MAG: hypothetical protein M1821_004659 [Bathelium mastoideum]|nr:MAG: hypothetical protein M1821_004659 [Bathelium mastoideum]
MGLQDLSAKQELMNATLEDTLKQLDDRTARWSEWARDVEHELESIREALGVWDGACQTPVEEDAATNGE